MKYELSVNVNKFQNFEVQRKRRGKLLIDYRHLTYGSGVLLSLSVIDNSHMHQMCGPLV